MTTHVQQTVAYLKLKKNSVNPDTLTDRIKCKLWNCETSTRGPQISNTCNCLLRALLRPEHKLQLRQEKKILQKRRSLKHL